MMTTTMGKTMIPEEFFDRLRDYAKLAEGWEINISTKPIEKAPDKDGQRRSGRKRHDRNDLRVLRFLGSSGV